MLGIANIADNSNENKDKIEFVLGMMLYHSATYNSDGAGIAVGFSDGTSSCKKTAESAETWAGKLSLTREKDWTNVIGHTRMATHGAVCELNSHPLPTSFGWLSHNGWCPELYRKHQKHMKTGCDSEVLAYFFNPDPEVFNSFMEGQEHYCFAHLSEDGSNIQLFNKNKSMWLMHSAVISADIFCTSRNVLLEVCSILEENPNIEPVPDNTTILFEDGSVTKEHFEFKDTPWRNTMLGSYSRSSEMSRFYDISDYFEYNQQRAIEAKTSFSQPKKLSRKERKRKIKEEIFEKLFKNFLDESDK